MDVDLRHPRAFVAVARHGSLTRAAKALHIEPGSGDSFYCGVVPVLAEAGKTFGVAPVHNRASSTWVRVDEGRLNHSWYLFDLTEVHRR